MFSYENVSLFLYDFKDVSVGTADSFYSSRSKQRAFEGAFV